MFLEVGGGKASESGDWLSLTSSRNLTTLSGLDAIN